MINTNYGFAGDIPGSYNDGEERRKGGWGGGGCCLRRFVNKWRS